jgi:hypothetical protein
VVATISQPDHQLLQGRTHPEDQRPKDVTRHFGIKRPDYISAARLVLALLERLSWCSLQHRRLLSRALPGSQQR